jgi:hypothetical protein
MTPRCPIIIRIFAPGPMAVLWLMRWRERRLDLSKLPKAQHGKRREILRKINRRLTNPN